ncbi:MAG: ABC transporter permease [Chloroflexota bacterium]
MNRLWLVFSQEFVRGIKRKGYLFATLGIPLLAVVIFFGYAGYQSLQSPEEEETNTQLEQLDLEQLETAGIVDFSGVFTELPERFTEVIISYPDEASALNALNADEIDVYLVFPEDYLETGEATLNLPNLNLILAGEGQTIGEQLAYSTFATGLDEIRLSRLSNPAIYTDFDLSLSGQASNSATEGGQFFALYVFAATFFISLILTNTYLMQTVIEERDNRMIEILLSTVTPTQLLAGKILALALLGLIQVVAWIIVAVVLVFAANNIELYATFVQTITVNFSVELFVMMTLYFVLMYFLYAAIFGMIGAISGSSQEGGQYVGFLILPAMIPFYMFSLIQNDPNGALSAGMSLFPITAPITMMARSIIATVPTWQIGLSLVILAVTTVGALWMAGRVFRVQTLLSGNNLKVGDLPRLIFASS